MTNTINMKMQCSQHYAILVKLSSRTLQSRSKINCKSGIQIPVRPTVIGTCKTTLSGKRSQLGGQPCGISYVNNKVTEQNYTLFNSLPNKENTISWIVFLKILLLAEIDLQNK